MQDRYVADVGDFGKYALLRRVVGHPPDFRLAVVWLLYPNEGHNNDGRHLGYLDSADYRALDPILHSRLSEIVRLNCRTIEAIAQSDILPGRTIFFDYPTHDHQSKKLRDDRVLYRENWLRRALEATNQAELVFLDPDNGVEVRSVPKQSAKAGKYVYIDELSAFWERGQSLVVYHHLNRLKSALTQTAELRERLRAIFGSDALLLPLLFRRGSCRHFWIVGQKEHSIRLRRRAYEMMQTGWSDHFELADE